MGPKVIKKHLSVAPPRKHGLQMITGRLSRYPKVQLWTDISLDTPRTEQSPSTVQLEDRVPDSFSFG